MVGSVLDDDANPAMNKRIAKALIGKCLDFVPNAHLPVRTAPCVLPGNSTDTVRGDMQEHVAAGGEGNLLLREIPKEATASVG